MSLKRNKTLMVREWLQNRWTWLTVVAVLPLLVLVTLPFGEVGAPGEIKMQVVPFFAAGATAMVCVMLAWATVLFMSTGLARRDGQDRSIEFWMSLPGQHLEHVGAQYLMHALFFPLLALTLGLLFGLLIAPLVLVKLGGFAALAGMPWLQVFAALLLPVLAAGLALVLAALWMAPIVLTLMAASIWLKRLALPALLVITVFAANWNVSRDLVRGFATAYAERLNELVSGVVGVLIDRVVAMSVPLNFNEGDLQRPMSFLGFLKAAADGLTSPQFGMGLLISAAALAILLAGRRRLIR